MAAVNDGRMFDTPFNVVAGFRSRAQAETAALALMHDRRARRLDAAPGEPDEKGARIAESVAAFARERAQAIEGAPPAFVHAALPARLCLPYLS